VFDRDLETIGLVASGHRLSVGASGMGLGLARALVSTGKVTSASPSSETGALVGGPAACLAGSCSQATLQQIANAERIMPVLHLDPDRIITGSDEAQRALDWARPRLANGPVLIASSSTPDQVAALQARHGRDAAGHAIEQAMADIAESLVKSGVRRLVVAGGETSGAVVDRLKVPGFLVGVEIAAGVPVLRAVGAEGDMLLALKSGNFGGAEFFSDALRLMR
ncbi:nucleotide-binding domain containing protein, partial [Bradyrhizobium sp.]|uniref:four-carbon acid sugar kinase family protein n=1 Tax=Bradyrhizobium sp. TaxID=376 RepID=UPI0025C1E761